MYNLDRLKKIDIIKVARALNIEVRKNKAMCYNGHDKLTPSLSFNPKTNIYKCFGCSDSGTVLDLVSKVKKITLIQSANWLSHNFNIIQTQRLPEHAIDYVKTEKRNKHGSDYSVIYEWFVSKLNLSKTTLDYLKFRCISETTIREFNIKDFKGNQELKSQGIELFGEIRMIESGLLERKQNKTSGSYFTSFKFWNHIIFPFYSGDRIVNIQGRTLNDNYSKYLNLNGIEQTIYNTNALSKIKQGDTLFICEGIMDVLSLYQMGLESIGIMGASSFNPAYVDLLLPYEIKVVAHNDEAGSKLFEKIRAEFIKRKIIISRVYLPYNVNDANDLLKEQSCKLMKH